MGDSSWGFIHDCFARVGGQEAPYTARNEGDHLSPIGDAELVPSEARCENMVQINTPCVAGDNLWLWRADHWLSDEFQVYNHENFCPRCLHVSAGATHVTMYGLFAEHALSDMTLWEGEHGITYFYQSEFPYDALDEKAATEIGVQPFAGVGYRVADGVMHHEAYGVGVYAFFRDHDVSASAGVRAPGSAGVVIKNAFTRFLNGGPVRYVPGKAGHTYGQKYGRIQCVIDKGGVRQGSSTDADKGRCHWSST